MAGIASFTKRTSVDMAATLKPSKTRKALRQDGSSGFDINQCTIRFEKAPDPPVCCLMGKARRSAITGEVSLRRSTSMPDFTIVDLYERSRVEGSLEGSLSSFKEDKYLFKPIPLLYRTWFYHYYYLYDQSKLIQTADESATVKYVLGQRTIDANESAGRWSPLMCYVPMVFCTCLTGDMLLVGPGVCAIIAIYMITVFSNIPQLYRFTRVILLPVRLLYILVIALRFQGLDMIGVIGVILAGMMFLADLILGDLRCLFCYRLHCQYEVVQVLPQRIFVCKVKGASHMEEDGAERRIVNEAVTGIGNWEKNMALVADLYGILVELTPLNTDDWMRIYEEYTSQNSNLQVLPVCVYNEEKPTQHALHCHNPMELEKIVETERDEMTALWGQEVPAWKRITHPLNPFSLTARKQTIDRQVNEKMGGTRQASGHGQVSVTNF
jgi:hypothetical protein